MKESTTQKNVILLSSEYERLKDKTIDLTPYIEIFSQDTEASSFSIKDGRNKLIITKLEGTIDPNGEVKIHYANGYYLEKSIAKKTHKSSIKKS